MMKRKSWDEIISIIEEGERFDVELKNSTYFDENHRLNLARKIKYSDLKIKLKAELAQECGAFANSGGGTLIFGVEDSSREIDEFLIPRLKGATKIEDWVASILKESLQPPLEAFNCYLVEEEKNESQKHVLVIDVAQSEKAPHQSVIDKKYYTRHEKSSTAAEHWLIEAIRNRRIHPKLGIELNHSNSKITKIQLGSLGQPESINFDLEISVINEGSILANHWAIRVDCPFATEVQMSPREGYVPVALYREDSMRTVMKRAEAPLFPTQSINLKIRLTIPSYWKIEAPYNRKLEAFYFPNITKTMADIAGQDAEEQWFNVTFQLYADSAGKYLEVVKVTHTQLRPKMEDHLKDIGEIKI